MQASASSSSATAESRGPPRVSVLVAAHNASLTLPAALDSLLVQDFAGEVEVCLYDDASTDGTGAVVQRWWEAATAGGHAPVTAGGGRVTLTSLPPVAVPSSSSSSSTSSAPPAPRAHGAAFARNRAAAAATGAYMAILDADDVCLPSRLRLQLAAAQAAEARGETPIVGCRFTRDPPEATPTYTQWANGLTQEDVYAHAWRECSLVQPTWFFPRRVFFEVGGYDEAPPALLGAAGVGAGGKDTPLPAPSSSSRHPFDGVVATAAVDLASIAAAAAGSPVGSFPLSPLEAVAASTAAGAASSSSASSSPSPPYALTVAPWPEHEAPFRHPPILSRPPLKLIPGRLHEHSAAEEEPFGEDPLFWHRHLARGGTLVLVPGDPLLVYRYGSGSLSWRTPRPLLQRIRAALFEERFLAPRWGHAGAGGSSSRLLLPPAWGGMDRGSSSSAAAAAAAGGVSSPSPSSSSFPRSFSIWSAGRDGKAFYNALSPAGRAQVLAFADIDPRKVGLTYPAGSLAADSGGGGGGGHGPPLSKRAQKRMQRLEADAVDKKRPLEQLLLLDEEGVPVAADKRSRADEVAPAPSAAAAAPPAGAGTSSPAPPRPGPRPIVPIGSASFPLVCCVSLESGGEDLVRNMRRVGRGGDGGERSAGGRGNEPEPGPAAWPPNVKPGENIVFFV
jgi:hypothetical protein